MTGEITLRGKVLPIGGLKEKSMAAYKNGIKLVLIPKQNEPDISEIDPAVKEKVDFVSVEDFKDVVSLAVIDPVEVSEKAWNNINMPVQPKTSSAVVRQ